MHDIKSTTAKHAPTLLVILMAMRIRRYKAERIAQYGRSSVVLLFVVMGRICVTKLVLLV